MSKSILSFKITQNAERLGLMDNRWLRHTYLITWQNGWNETNEQTDSFLEILEDTKSLTTNTKYLLLQPSYEFFKKEVGTYKEKFGQHRMV